MPKTTFDVDSVLDRLKKMFKIESDADLARLLGLNSNAVTLWRKRGSIDLVLICSKCMELPTPDWKMVNLHWLITGEREPAAFDTVYSDVLSEVKHYTLEQHANIIERVAKKLRAQGQNVPDDIVEKLLGRTDAEPEH